MSYTLIISLSGLYAQDKTITVSNPSSLPKIENDYGYNYEIGLVYQTAILGGEDLGNTLSGQINRLATPATVVTTGTSIAAKNKFHFGINAAVGYRNPKNSWDVKITNNYFNGSDEVSNSAFDPSEPLFTFIFADKSSSNKIHSTLSIGYDLLGIELGDNLQLNPHFAFRPMIGLLSNWNWVNEKTQIMGYEIKQNHIEEKITQIGLGPQFGFESNWALSSSWSLFLDAKAALLYGTYKDKKEDDTTLLLGTTPFIYSLTSKISNKRILPYTQTFIGLSYQFFFKERKDFIKLRAGYNLQYFFGLNQKTFNNYIDTKPAFPLTFRIYNSLQTQGLQIDFAYSF